MEFGQYLEPTSTIDSGNPLVTVYARKIAGDTKQPLDLAIKLYLAVRDGIRYDPYAPSYKPEHYRASFVIRRGRSFCVPKASLLCALGRVCGIPSRVGFAHVRNHLATKELIELLRSDIFYYHGFVEFFLEGQWVKCTPAFNRELCEKHGVPPLEFDGRKDSIFQEYNAENRRFMEYIEFLGAFADIPIADIIKTWEKGYGRDIAERMARVSAEKEKSGARQFEDEDVWKG